MTGWEEHGQASRKGWFEEELRDTTDIGKQAGRNSRQAGSEGSSAHSSWFHFYSHPRSAPLLMKTHSLMTVEIELTCMTQARV